MVAKFDAVSKTIGDITVVVARAEEGNAGERLVKFLEWLGDKVVDPGYGVGSPARPDNTLPGSGSVDDIHHPDNSLPEGGVPSQLPAFIRENAREIAKAILQNTMCDMDKPQPKKPTIGSQR